MRRDTIFYKLFKQFPGLLFELVDEPPREAQNYQFESVEVKKAGGRRQEAGGRRQEDEPPTRGGA
jgi:predicted transposase YdaD